MQPTRNTWNGGTEMRIHRPEARKQREKIKAPEAVRGRVYARSKSFLQVWRFHGPRTLSLPFLNFTSSISFPTHPVLGLSRFVFPR